MTATTAPQSATNAELVRWAFEMLNQHDVSPLKQFWTADTVERFPDRACRGPEEIARYFEDKFSAIPDFHMEILALAEDGENILVRWRLTGTHQGSMQGVHPTGQKLSIDGIDHFVLRDGKVISNFVVFDQIQSARQIGLMPADGSTADKALKSAFNARTRLRRRKNR
jgi:steroid delta-isomerase-like uncharacterized protein